MKKNTNSTAQKNDTASELVSIEASELAMTQTHKDVLVSTLIVSLLVNAFVFIGWVALKVTSVYDYQVVAFLFTR